jgi:hypothetical protein
MTELAIPEATPTTPGQSAPAALVAWANAANAANQLAKPLCQTDFVPAHFRGKEHDATAAILYGAEAGLSPLQALQGIYVIGGRPALYSRTKLAITMAAGHEVWTEESTENRAIVCGRRRGAQHVERVVVTMDQARKAGWTKNAKYNSEPATMLLARAQSQVCSRIAPDALLGMSYTVEELEDEQPSSTTVARTEAPKRTVRRQAAPVAPEPPLDEPEHPDVRHAREGSVSPEAAAQVPDTGEMMTEPQSRKLHAVLREQGLGNREDALRYLSTFTGRTITTSKELTKAEASEIIDALEQPVEAAEPEL